MTQAKDLTLLHPQVATRLLLKCVAPAPGYLSQVCHGDITYPEFIKFDNELWKLWRTILGGVGGTEQLKLCNLGHTRARGWAYLPASCSGAGLSSWSAISKYSWFCSMAECSTQYDVDFECSRAFRRADCESAHLVALTARGAHLRQPRRPSVPAARTN